MIDVQSAVDSIREHADILARAGQVCVDKLAAEPLLLLREAEGDGLIPAVVIAWHDPIENPANPGHFGTHLCVFPEVGEPYLIWGHHGLGSASEAVADAIDRARVE